MTKIKYITTLLAIVLLSCSGRQVKPTFTVSEKNTISQSLKDVEAANSRAPETLTSQITIIGTLNNKKYSAAGSIAFDKKADILNIVLHDFVFKSPITTFIKSKDDVSIYSPIDNQLILTSMKAIKPKMILDINLESNALISLIQGQVPLLKNYFVKQIYREEKSSRNYLVIENKETYETICINRGNPERLLFVDKKKKQKTEVYSKMKKYAADSGYYRQLQIKSEADATDLLISFSSVTVNKPVKLKTEDDISIPRGTKVFRLR